MAGKLVLHSRKVAGTKEEAKRVGDMEWLRAQTEAEVLVRGSCFIQFLFYVAGLNLMSSEREVRETGKQLKMDPWPSSG